MSGQATHNLYEVLNLSDDATNKEIRRRYLFLSKTFHPDKQPPEFYDQTARYFENIETAYKILSVPLERYIYDNYGIEGNGIIREKAQKFYELGEEYKRLVDQDHLQSNVGGEKCELLSREDTKSKLKKVKRKIRSTLEYVALTTEERSIYNTFNKDLTIEMNIDVGEFVRYYVTRETMLIQQDQQNKVYPNLRSSRFFLQNFIALPSFQGGRIIGPYHHLIGICGSQFQKEAAPVVGVKYRFSAILFPEKYNIELMGMGNYLEGPDGQKGITLNIGKQLNSGLTLSLTGTAMNVDKSLAVELSKKLGEDLTTSAQLQLSGIDNCLIIGATKDFSNQNIRSETSIEAYSDRVRISQSFSKQYQKRFQGITSINAIVHKNGFLCTLNFGFRYRLSSLSKFQWSTILGFQSFGVDFRYQRLGLNLHLPVTITSRFEPITCFMNIFTTLSLGYLVYLYDKWKRSTSKIRRKLEEKNRNRLSDCNKTFHLIVGEIATDEFVQKVIEERERCGLIILKALYGKPSLVHKEYKKDLKSHNNKSIVEFDGDIIEMVLKVDTKYVNSMHLEREFSEMIDLRIILQNMVVNSRLSLNHQIISAIPGVYNPCVDDQLKSHLYLKFYLNKVIYFVYIDEKQQLDIDPDVAPNFVGYFNNKFSIFKMFKLF